VPGPATDFQVVTGKPQVESGRGPAGMGPEVRFNLIRAPLWLR